MDIIPHKDQSLAGIASRALVRRYQKLQLELTDRNERLKMDQERSDAAVTDLEKELAEVLGPTLDRMAQQSHRISRSKGWWETPDPFDRKCMLMVTELAEAVEEQRDNHPLDEIYYADGKPEGVPIELADLLIRLLDACAYFKIPLAKAYAIKTAFNTTRPQKHGGKAF